MRPKPLSLISVFFSDRAFSDSSAAGHGSNACQRLADIAGFSQFSRKEPHCNNCLQTCCPAFHFLGAQFKRTTMLERSVLILLLQTLHKLLVLLHSCCNLLILSFNFLRGGLYPLPVNLPGTCYWGLFRGPAIPRLLPSSGSQEPCS